MRLKEIIARTSPDGHCPAVYKTDAGTFVVQGWKLTDSEARGGLVHVHENEDAVEVPADLLRQVVEKLQ